jgi:hypothetical protein
MSEPQKKDRLPLGWWNPAVKTFSRPVDWIWEGFIAWQGITLLTGASKVGKSTLLGMLLDRRRAGGTLLGGRVLPGITIVISEEEIGIWARRQRRLDFGPDVCFTSADLSTYRRWRRFVNKLLDLELPNQREFDLVVIDSLASFLPAAENHAGSLRKAFKELRLFQAGVLLMHHPRRAGGRPGHAARGSAALSAFVDIDIEMRAPGGDPSTHRRQLHALGRYPGIPEHLLIEMNPEATDYAILAETEEAAAAFASGFDALRELLGRSSEPLDQQEILDRWPNPATRPAPVTLWRLLTRGCDTGLLVRVGEGNKKGAYRYGLAGATAACGAPIIDLSPEEVPEDASTRAAACEEASETVSELPAAPANGAGTEALPGQPPEPSVEPEPPLELAAESLPATRNTAAPELPEHARWLLGYLAPRTADEAA